ncbi:MAG: RNA-directed polymerase [Gemmataceae bacterium]|nr:RNA-directed polymerase [Gemmataceae bacterium]
MPTFDTARFLSSLAGAFLAGVWTATALRAALKAATADRPVQVPGLIPRLLAKYPQPPEFGALSGFLAFDPGMTRALNRLTGRPNPNPRRRTRPIRPQVMGQPPARLGPLSIPPLATETALATWLGLSDGKLRWYADLTGRNRKHPAGPLRHYRYRWVPKRRGPARLLEIPKPGLKQIQRKVLDEILAKIPLHSSTHGFRSGHSIVTNAVPHCGKRIVLRFDFADFFPSVPVARVVRIFRTVGYPETVARLLAGLCTTCLPADGWAARPNPPGDGSDHSTWQRLAARHLPQGAPTSPALANLAAFRLDRRLAKLAATVGADYTRYADDLTFSGGDELARRVKRFAAAVAVVSGEEGFTLNYRKIRVMRRGGRQHVTGVVVNARPNVPRAEFDRLKAILTNCARHAPGSQNRENRPDFRAHLAGKVSHVSAVNPTRGRKLRAIFDRIQWEVPGPGGTEPAPAPT